MNTKTARIITFLFGIVFLLTSSISMYRYSTATKTTAVITEIKDIREMSDMNNNPLYRDYYEEDVQIYYTCDTSDNPPDSTYVYSDITIKGLFKQQLPDIDDTIPIIIYKDGSIKENTMDGIAKPMLMMMFGMGCIIYFCNGIKKQKK